MARRARIGTESNGLPLHIYYTFSIFEKFVKTVYNYHVITKKKALMSNRTFSIVKIRVEY